MGNAESSINNDIKRGYLDKREFESKLFRRHYVVLNDHTLSLFDDEFSDNYTERIDLNAFNNVTLHSMGTSGRFQLRLSKYNTENDLLFIASSTDANDWFKHIKAILHNINKNNLINDKNMENKMEEETCDDLQYVGIGSNGWRFKPHSFETNNKTYYYQNISVGEEVFKSKSCEELRFEDQFKKLATPEINYNVNQQKIEEMKYEVIEKDKEVLQLKMKILEMENNKLKQEKSEALNTAEIIKQKILQEEKNATEKDKKIQLLKENSKYIVLWQWKENDGKFISYDADMTGKIEQLAVNQKFTFTTKINKQSYTIRRLSEAKGIQRNMKTNKIREIIRKKQVIDALLLEKAKLEEKVEDVGYLIRWQWDGKPESKKGVWNSYDEQISKQIETLNINQPFQFKCIQNGQTYKIIKQSKETAFQINIVTKVKRKCKRFREGVENLITEAKKYKLKAEEECKKMEEKQSEYEELKKKIGYKVVWELDSFNDNKQWEPFSENLSMKIENLKIGQMLDYKDKNSKSYTIMRMSKDTAISSFISDPVKTWSYRRKEQASGLNQIEYPPWWFYNKLSKTGYIGSELIDLNANNDVSKEVCERFGNSLPEYQITEIQGVRNQMLYEKFWNERKSTLKAVGQNKLNEQYLFHGTRTENIMESVMLQGWRKEFNKKSKYGKGTYFAKLASVSLPYAAKSLKYPDEYKMILAKVILGEYALGNSSYDLTTWPKKQNGLIYDSLVNYKTKPSIFVIHENARAYPMYIVHFRKKRI
eukprot:25216_1